MGALAQLLPLGSALLAMGGQGEGSALASRFDVQDESAGREVVMTLRDAQEFLHPRELYHESNVELPISDALTQRRNGPEAVLGRVRFVDHLRTFVAPGLALDPRAEVRVTPFGTLVLKAIPEVQDRVDRHLEAVRARTPRGGVMWNRIEVEMLTVRIDGTEAQGLDGGEVAVSGGTRLLSEAELEPWLRAMDEGRRDGAVEVLDRRFLSFSDGGEGKDSGLESLRYIADYEVRVGVHPYPDDHELVIPVIEDLVAGVVLEADGCILGDERVGLRFRARDRELLALREFETLHGPIALPEILERRFAADLILDTGQGALITSPGAAVGEPVRGVLIRATPVLAEVVPDRAEGRSPR